MVAQETGAGTEVVGGEAETRQHERLPDPKSVADAGHAQRVMPGGSPTMSSG